MKCANCGRATVKDSATEIGGVVICHRKRCEILACEARRLDDAGELDL